MLDAKYATAGAGCLMLFGLPFALGGLLALWATYREWSSGDPQQEWWVAGLVGGVFTFVGCGIMAGGWMGRGKLREYADLQQRHPGRPWMWRADWAQGRVESDARGEMAFAWIFAILWNGISAAPLLANREELPDEIWMLALIGLFPLVGFFLLVWAVRATLRYRKFGVSRLELSTRPGVVGERLAGRIETRLREPPEDGVALSLESVRLVRSGKSTQEQSLWKADHKVPFSRLSRGQDGVMIPVELAIPADAEETQNSPGRVLWRLTADARVAGVDFHARFEVPVFRSARSGSGGTR